MLLVHVYSIRTVRSGSLPSLNRRHLITSLRGPAGSYLIICNVSPMNSFLRRTRSVRRGVDMMRQLMKATRAVW
jgi:hypothetical protein